MEIFKTDSIESILYGDQFVWASLVENKTSRCCNSKFLRINIVGIDRPRNKTQTVIRPKGRIDYQLLYIAKGRGYFYENNESEKRIFESGHFTVFAPGMPQCYIYYPEDEISTYWVHFTGYGVKTILKELHINPGEFYKINSSNSQINELFGKIISAVLAKNKYCEIEAAGYLTTLLSFLSRENSFYSESAGKVNEKLFPALEYIRLNFNKKFTNRELSKLCNLSVSHFSHLFTQAIGMPPNQYCLSLRLNFAKQQLADTDFTVSEISYSSGFSDPLYFSKIFKKYIGISPNNYRRKQQKN